MNCCKVFKEIERLQDKYIDVWEEFCDIESPTDCKAGVDKCGSYACKWAQDMGFDVECMHQDISGDVVCITMNPNAPEAPVCVSGHMDTVHPIGMFGKKPVHREGDKIYGPGVTDCKGGVVASMLAMEALKNCGFCTRPVKLLLQSDEEKGSMPSGKSTIDWICHKAEGSLAFLNMEGHPTGNAIVERKGIVTFEFKVKGIKAHSSACATSGANAIAAAAHKLIEMEKLKDDNGLTCNCGVINGGTVPNTVPDRCVFLANVRFASQKELDFVREYARKVSETVHVEGTTCSIREVSFRVAMEKDDHNYELLEEINHIYEENGMAALEPMRGRGGSDAADTTVYGIPSIDGLGTEGGAIHSKEEFAYIDSLQRSAKRVASVMCCI